MQQNEPASPTTPTPKRDFRSFIARVEFLLSGKAATKGYNASGPDSENALYKFVLDLNGDHGHAIGEVIYKIRRWRSTRNDEDLEKAAAWLYLIWKHAQPPHGGSDEPSAPPATSERP